MAGARFLAINWAVWRSAGSAVNAAPQERRRQLEHASDALCPAIFRLPVQRRRDLLPDRRGGAGGYCILELFAGPAGSRPARQLRAAGDDPRPRHRRQPDRRICPRAPALPADPGRARSSSSRLSCRPRTRTSTSIRASIRRASSAPSSSIVRSGGRREQGASTITQQVAKNFLVGNERSYERKIREALIALRMESTFSKDKILELYLNEIYPRHPDAGRNLTASPPRRSNYFGKSVHELTIAEAAYLAALPKGAEQLSPVPPAQGRHRAPQLGHRSHGRERLRHAARTATRRKKEPLNVNPRCVSPNTIASGYFAEEVRREIAERYGEQKLYEGGLRSARPSIRRCRPWPARRSSTVSCASTRRAAGAERIRRSISPAANGAWRWPKCRRSATCSPGGWPSVLEVAADRPRSACSRARSLRPDGQATARPAPSPPTASNGPAARSSKRLAVGDVVYVEPIDGKPGQFRLRQVPGDLRRHRRHGSRIRAASTPWSAASPSTRASSTARRRRMRQPGSSFKPFVYATALDNGYTPSSMILDAPIDDRHGPGPGGLAAGELRRQVRRARARCATASSIRKNLMTVRLAQGRRHAADRGICPPLRRL